MIESLWLPPGYRYRELWMPQNIIPNTSLLRSVHSGHDLALTGAQLGSTVDGLEMRGAERITITDHADIHITDNLTVVLPAFILTTLFDNSAGADMGLMNLNNGAVIARLNSTTGALDFIFNDVDGGTDETVSTSKVSWAVDTIWQVAFTFANNGTGVISVRLYINGVAENTNDQVDGVIVVPAGDTVLGEDLTTFFTSKFQRVLLVYDTAILTEVQLLEVYKGIPYATNLKAYVPLDHPGRGLVMPDRSVGGNCSGTISGTATANIWDFGQVKQPVWSLDEINDFAIGTGLNIAGAVSAVWIGRVKTTYDNLADDHRLYQYRVDAGNSIILIYTAASNDLEFQHWGGGDNKIISYSTKPAIDDYLIFIHTIDGSGNSAGFVNGTLIGVQTSGGIIPGNAATIHIGSSSIPSFYDVSRPLFVALIDGVFTNKDALAYSRYLKNIFNLPITI